MALHDAFWALVGGSAPVIALAAVVSKGELRSVKERYWDLLADTLSGARLSDPAFENVNQQMGRLNYANSAQNLNFLLQTGALAFALLGIDDPSRGAAYTQPIAGTFVLLGMCALAYAGVVTSQALSVLAGFDRKHREG